MKRKSLMKEIILHRVFLSLILVMFCLYFGFNNLKNHLERQETLVFAQKLGTGWNLGNTLDAYSKEKKSITVEESETQWHNPITTRQLFKTVKNAGFETVRIPVTWYGHLDDNGTIDPKWLLRVSEVVDMALAQDLYVIINVHHDTWLDPGEDNYENGKKMIASVWGQIAYYFSEYDENLLFEGMNEPRLLDTANEWDEGTLFARDTINEYNNLFVKTVRDTGGNNQNRYLLITPYCSSTEEEVIRDLAVPKDLRVMVSLHAYIPYQFALNESGTSSWSADNEADVAQIDSFFSLVNQYYTSKGVPAVITEFGVMNKDNLTERLEWLDYFKEKADEQNISYIWWDEGAREGKIGKFQLLNRYKNEWIFPEIVEVLTE